MVLFIGNQRAMHINRHFPSKRIVKAVILRRRRKILVTPDNMRNSHQMVIDHIRKIIGRISVGLN